MAHTHSAASADAHSSPQKPVEGTLIGTLLHLWPYIWPGDRADLKMRVVWSMVLLLLAKVATLAVPFTFKWAIDALTGADTAPVQPSNWTLWLIASPLIMTASYGMLRVLMADPAPAYADAAEALGLPVGSLGPTRARCLDRLRRLVARRGISGPSSDSWEEKAR